MPTPERMEAWGAFQRWWHSHIDEASSPAVDEAEDVAAAAWLAACEWAWSLRSDE